MIVVTREMEKMAEIIWTTSRNDEGSISAMGANVIAAALVARGYILAPSIAQREQLRPQGARTIKETANVLGVSTRAVYRYIEKGLKTTYTRHFRWIYDDDLVHWLKENNYADLYASRVGGGNYGYILSTDRHTMDAD